MCVTIDWLIPHESNYIDWVLNLLEGIDSKKSDCELKSVSICKKGFPI